MNSKNIQDMLYDYIVGRDFNAPYGVLTSEHVNSKGRKYLSVTFGRARTLDATIEIYNRNFMLLRVSNKYNAEVFKNYNDLIAKLASI